MSENQQAQQELLEQARELPGVAEAVEVYSRIEPYTHRPMPAAAFTAYATGGNQ